MTRQRIAILLAAVVLVAGVVAGRERPSIELVKERAPQAAAAVDDGLDLEKLRRREALPPKGDPFTRRESQPKPTLAAHNPAPAKPVAPPLPFRYFGKLTKDGKTEVFVTQGEELISIAKGQNIGQYRVEQVSDALIAFTYLPLKTRQTLDLENPVPVPESSRVEAPPPAPQIAQISEVSAPAAEAAEAPEAQSEPEPQPQ